MGRYTRGALYFTGLLSVLALAATAAGLFLIPDSGADWTTFILLAGMAAVSHLYPVKSAKEGVVYVVANAFIFAGVLLLSPWQLSLLCVAALTPNTIKGAKRPGAMIRFAFNTSQTILASLTSWALIQASGAREISSIQDMAWVALALALFVAIPLVAVAGIVALNTRTHFLRTQIITLHAVMADSLTPFVGALIATLWYDHPWVLGFSVLPVLLAYRLMRQVQLVTNADLDPKTGLYNFRCFQELAQEELRRSASLRRSVAILFCDLDFLREVNNTLGHLAGDKVLEQVAMLLLRELPLSAIVSRFGGEEFVAMLPGVDKEEAFHVAEKLRRAVAHHLFDVGDGKTAHVTICIGISGSPLDGTNLTLLAERADQALYQAKNAGRNRSCVWQGRMTVAAEQESSPSAGPEDERPPELRPVTAPAPPASKPAAPRSDSPRRRQDFPRLLVIGAGLAAVGAGLASIGPGFSWPTLLVCLAAGAVAELLDVRLVIPTRHAVSVSPAVAAGLASGALLGPAGGVLVAVGSATVHGVKNRRTQPLQFLLNMSLAVLSNGASGLIFMAAGSVTAVGFSLQQVAVGLLATAVNFLVNTLLASAVVGYTTKRSPLLLWWDSFAWLAPQFILTGVTGVVAVFAYRFWGLSGALCGALLILICHFSVTMSVWGHQKALNEAHQAQKNLEELHELQRETLNEWTRTLAAIVDARDGSMGGHSDKVAFYAAALADELGVPPEEVESIRLAALLHDLGKIGIPEQILNKPAKLTPDEWTIMREHALLGQRLLSQISALKKVSVMVGEHHERYDGTGYPFGRTGAELTLGGRIITLADALDTMLSGRPYAEALSPDASLAELRACAGKQFDPMVVEALGRLVETRGSRFLQVPPATTSESA